MSFRIHTGDMRDVCHRLRPGTIDVIITDPPYGDTSLAWDKPLADWLAVLRPALKVSGSVWIFGSLRFFINHCSNLTGWKFAQDIVWEKHNGSGAAADRFRRVHEHAIHLYRDDAPWSGVYKEVVRRSDGVERTVRRANPPTHYCTIGGGVFISAPGGSRLERSVIKVPSCHGTAVHPTQKPTGILDPLVTYSCPLGGIVLDPFAGSGSTGVSALSLGRRFVGVELNPEYAALARARCDAAVLKKTA